MDRAAQAALSCTDGSGDTGAMSSERALAPVAQPIHSVEFDLRSQPAITIAGGRLILHYPLATDCLFVNHSEWRQVKESVANLNCL